MTDDLIFAASGFELLFLASALIGAWISTTNMSEAWRDLRALGGITNGRRAIAIAAIVIETLLLYIHALYIIAGLVAAFTPSRGDATVSTVLLSAVIVYASWAITSISFVTRKTRRYLLAHGLQNRDAQGRFIKATNGTGRDLEEHPE
ncbi:MAG TPA: hypothetical protein VK845_04845 [Gemmatimonadales bacterium]|nr:hypothetical protein [Gemmatimonadales bacterium]